MQQQSAIVRGAQRTESRGFRLSGLRGTIAANPCELTQLPASLRELTCLWGVLEESCAEKHLLFEDAGYPSKSAAKSWQLPCLQWRHLLELQAHRCGRSPAALPLCWVGSSTKAGEGHRFWWFSQGVSPVCHSPHCALQLCDGCSLFLTMVGGRPRPSVCWVHQQAATPGSPAAAPTPLVQITMLMCAQLLSCPICSLAHPVFLLTRRWYDTYGSISW